MRLEYLTPAHVRRAVVIYNKGGWALWMLMHHMGREAFLEGTREYFRAYHVDRDNPVIQDFVAALAPYAPAGAPGLRDDRTG